MIPEWLRICSASVFALICAEDLCSGYIHTALLGLFTLLQAGGAAIVFLQFGPAEGLFFLIPALLWVAAGTLGKKLLESSFGGILGGGDIWCIAALLLTTDALFVARGVFLALFSLLFTELLRRVFGMKGAESLPLLPFLWTGLMLANGMR